MYDMIVVGGGPAGMTAALYGRRNGRTVLIIEKNVFGGQITNSPRVENIPGFKSVSGDEFADLYMEQIIAQGAELIFEEVVSVEDGGAVKIVRTAEGNRYEAPVVVLATGTTHRLLGLEGEEELIGNGIHFCAVCDGDFYKDRTVCIAGGGNSAFVEAVLLAGICKKLIMLQDMPFFTADAKLQDELFSHENVETRTGVRITELLTENGKLKGVRYRISEGAEEAILCDGLFLAIGLVPDNDRFANVAALDEKGYFRSGEDCCTGTAGIFAAGDCRAKKIRQVATACADGAVAAIGADYFIRPSSSK